LDPPVARPLYGAEINLHLEESYKEAQPTSNQNDEVWFTGTVNVILPPVPGIRATVQLTSVMDTQWDAFIQPTQMEIDASVPRPFSVKVVIPAGTNDSVRGSLLITANMMVTGLPPEEATVVGTVAVVGSFQASLILDETMITAPKGTVVYVKGAVTNNGNSDQTFRVEGRAIPEGVKVRTIEHLEVPQGESVDFRLKVTVTSEADEDHFGLQVVVLPEHGTPSEILTTQSLILDIVSSFEGYSSTFYMVLIVIIAILVAGMAVKRYGLPKLPRRKKKKAKAESEDQADA
jgi:hypothetical protein